MISGIQQCVGKFDIKNKDLIEYLRTSIYLIYTRCLSVWSRPHIGQGNSDRLSRFHWFFFTQFKNCEAMTTLICWFSSQLFHAVHVCFMSAIGETRGRINLVRETPSICSPPKIDSITQRTKYPVEKYPTKKYPIENSGAKFERNGCLWCRSREIVHLSLGIDMELIQLPIIWTDVEPSNHKNYFFFIVSEQKHCQLGFGTLGT